MTSPIPYTSVRKNGGLAFGKTWLGNFFVLVREVKILRATTEKFGLWVKLQAIIFILWFYGSNCRLLF
ncbi:hypothetical protein CS550_00185 [Porphyromonas gingivalis]|nr:hypothetical protein CS550_00185 [Porphyromonas gingivalis]